MKYLKRLAVTAGAFGGMCAMIWLTGVAANGYIRHPHYFVGMFTLSVIVLICVWYIDKYTEGGKWID